MNANFVRAVIRKFVSAMRQLPAGVVGVCVCVWLCEAFVAKREDAYLPSISRSWRYAANATRSSATGCDVLCFGDSQVKYGVLPRVLEKSYGLRGHNLAMLRGMPGSSLALLQRALALGARPRAVVIDFNDTLLAAPPRLNAELWPDVLDARGTIALLMRARDPVMAARMAAARLLPSLTFRDEVAVALRSAFLGVECPIEREHREETKIWPEAHGAHPYLGPNLGGLSSPTSVGDVSNSNWTWSPQLLSSEDVDAFLSLCERKRIRPFWVIPPVCPALQDRRTRTGHNSVYTAFVKTVQAKHPALVVIDGRRSALDDSHFLIPPTFRPPERKRSRTTSVASSPRR